MMTDVNRLSIGDNLSIEQASVSRQVGGGGGGGSGRRLSQPARRPCGVMRAVTRPGRYAARSLRVNYSARDRNRHHHARTKGECAHCGDTYQHWWPAPASSNQLATRSATLTESTPTEILGKAMSRCRGAELVARYVKGATLRVSARVARSRRALVAGSRAECRYTVMQRAATVARTGKIEGEGCGMRAHPHR